MSLSHQLALRLDSLGLRRFVAWAVSLSRRGQRFAVDRDGRWLNIQPECTIASSSIQTARFNATQAVVLDAWCYRYRPRSGEVVVDVGSGFGEEAVVFSRLVGDQGKVITIEAHPETFACLQQTVAKSNLRNVVVQACALADCDRDLTISTIDNFLCNSVMSSAGKGLPVSARSLDSLADELGLEEIALLKMNIEGAERLAVSGMSRVAARIRNMAISCHDFVADSTGDDAFRSRRAVLTFLESNNFQVSTRPYRADQPWYRDYLYASRQC